MHVLVGSKHNDELIRLDRAVTETDWNKHFLSLLLDQGEECLKISNEICKASLGQIDDEYFVIGG